MQVQLSSGNYDIIASGETYLFHNTNELSIRISDGQDFHLHIKLRFLTDDSKEQRIHGEVIDECIVLSCFHFHDSGTGMTYPWKIANIQGKDIYITFWSFVDGTNEPKPRRVRYTLFADDRTNGGK